MRGQGIWLDFFKGVKSGSRSTADVPTITSGRKPATSWNLAQWQERVQAGLRWLQLQAPSRQHLAKDTENRGLPIETALFSWMPRWNVLASNRWVRLQLGCGSGVQ